MQTSITILAIETSCDETAAAIVRHSEKETVVLSNIVSSQIALHAPFGGVVPDLAAREHAKNILPVLKEALDAAHLSKEAIDAIAVTNGPGLIPALLIGTAAAKTLAYVWKKPLLGIHHIEGHIYANFIKKTTVESCLCEQSAAVPQGKAGIATGELFSPRQNSLPRKHIEFPLLALVVSGGHTQLVLMQDHFRYEILGETQDDAAGEAFDKVAKMLRLPYPGGPVVAKRADAYQPTTSNRQSTNNHQRNIHFPRPMLHSGDFNFSFSGLKTAVLYTLKKHPEKLQDEVFIDEVCHEFQEAVIETLVTKTGTALDMFRPKTLVIAGGVSANVTLRARLKHLVDEYFPETTFMTPEFTYSLDNAAMIAAAAAFRFEYMSETQKNNLDNNWKTLTAHSNLTLQNL